MRVRHVEQALAGLLGSELEQKGPLQYVDLDISRLRHLIWNGYGDEARRALRNIPDMAANAIWLNAPRGKDRIERFIQFASELRTYLTPECDDALVDYGRRYRAGLRIASSGAESVVNSLVNARMNKRRQMRWSPQGAHRVLQVRAPPPSLFHSPSWSSGGTVTLLCEERERSRPHGFSSRRDSLAPRGHRRGA
jgi:hypothetical protein